MKEYAFSLPRAILFDKDGTLVDFERTWKPVIDRAAFYAAGGDADLAARLLAVGGIDAQSGRTRPDSLFAAAGTAEIAAALVENGAPFAPSDLVHDLDAMFADAAADAVPVTDGLPELFAALRRRGLALGVASSDNAASVRASMAALGLSGALDFVCGYDSGHGVKPGPGMIEAFAETLGLATADIAMVGDNTHDVAMARAAGAGLAIGVLSGTGTRQTLAPVCDACLADVGALPAFLDTAAGSP